MRLLPGSFELCRLVAVMPPVFRSTASVAWFGGWTAKGVPICDPMRCFVPMGDPIASSTDHSIKRPCGGHESRTAIRGNDLFDQSIHHRVRYTGDVLRPFERCRL